MKRKKTREACHSGALIPSDGKLLLFYGVVSAMLRCVRRSLRRV